VGQYHPKADSILARRQRYPRLSVDGSGGNITLNTPVFWFARSLDYLGTVPATLDNNNRVDVNASGRLAAGITLPDVSFPL